MADCGWEDGERCPACGEELLIVEVGAGIWIACGCGDHVLGPAMGPATESEERDG